MARNMIAKIILEGESEYRNAVKNINAAQKELRSEMKLASTEFKGQQNSIDALTKKQEILTKQIEQQQNKVDAANAMWQHSNAEQEKAAEKVEKLSKAYEEAQKALEKMKESGTASNEELEEQEKKVEELGKDLESAEKNYENTSRATQRWQTEINNSQAELNRLDTELDDNVKYLKEAENSSDGCAKSIDEFGKEVKDTGEELKKSGDSAKVFGDVLKANLAGDAIVAGIKTICNGVKEMAEAAVEVGMEFDASMSKVQALSGATGAEFEALSNKAREMGSNTIYSASEAADALSYMALAGWDTQAMLNGIEPVLNLAAASQMDLAQASDIVTDYLTAFGLTSQDAAKFTDQMAYAMAHSNTNVSQLGEAYKNCAATAHSMGYSVEEVTAVLSTMANAGIKGGEAGTALNAVMTRLATNTKGCSDKLAEYGVHVYDTEGNMNSLSSILGQTANVWENLSMQEQAALAKTIAGTSHYSALQTIMNGMGAAVKDSGMSFEDYATALTKCDGAAAQMADTMNNNLKGDITILKSALSELGIAAEKTFDASLRGSVKGATEAVGRLSDAVNKGDLGVSLNKMGDALGKFIDKAVVAGESALPKLIDVLTWIVDHSSEIINFFEYAGSAVLAYNAAVEILTAVQIGQTVATEGATAAQVALNVAMEANPIGAVIAAIAALTLGVVALITNYENLTAELTEHTDAAERNIKSIEDSQAAYAEQQASISTNADTARKLADELTNLTSKQSLSNEEQARAQSIVEQLNQLYPELNLAYDASTNSLNMTNQALTSNIELLQKQAMATAIQDRLVENARQQLSVQDELAKNTEELNGILEECGIAQEDLANIIDETTGILTDEGWALQDQNTTVREYLPTITDLVTANEELKAEQEELITESETLTEQLDVQTEAVQEQAEAVQEATPVTIEYKDAMIELQGEAGTTAEQLQALAEAYNTAKDDALDSLQTQIGLFDELSEKTDLTLKQMSDRFEQQKTVLDNYGENISNLKGRVSDELLQALMDLGIDGAGYVAELASASDEELSALSESFEGVQESMNTVAEEMALAATNINTDAFEQVKTGATDMKDDLNQTGNDIVTDTQTAMQSSQTALTDGTTAQKNTVQQYATDVVGIFQNTWGISGTGANSTVFISFGQAIPESINTGLDNGWSTVVSNFQAKCDELVQIATETAQKIADAINSAMGDLSM